jgi:Flp pilus assembly protein TadG
MNIPSGLYRQAMVFMRGVSRTSTATKIDVETRSKVKGLRSFLGAGGEGHAIVETALVLPILIGVLVGLFKFAFIFNNYMTLTNAVNKAALSLQPGPDFIASTNTAPYTDPCTLVTSMIHTYGATLNPNNVTYTIIINNTANYPTLSSGATKAGPTKGMFACAAAPSLLPNTYATVIGTYSCLANIPDYWYSNTNFAQACVMTATSTVKII